MPIARIQMPDGRVARVEVPDGTTPEQAQQMALQVIPSAKKTAAPASGPMSVNPNRLPPRVQNDALGRPTGGMSRPGDLQEPARRSVAGPMSSTPTFLSNARTRDKLALPPQPRLAPPRLLDRNVQLPDGTTRDTWERPAEGYFDRAGIKLQDALASPIVGSIRLAAALLDGDPNNQQGFAPIGHMLANRLNDSAAASEFEMARPIAGETRFRDVSSAGDFGQWAAENAPGGFASLLAALTPAGRTQLLLGTSGNVAQQRAVSDGRTSANLTDATVGLPVGVVSTALDRIGAEGAAGKVVQSALTSTAPRRIATSGLTEFGTEGAQSGIEYAGGTVGTRDGFDAGEALAQMAEGAVLGGLIGSGTRGGVELATNAPAAIYNALPKKQAAIAPPLAPVETTPLQPTPEAAPAPAPVAVAPQPVEPPPAPQRAGSEATVQPPVGAGDDGLGQAAPAPAPKPKQAPPPAPAAPPAEPVSLRPEPGPVGEGERTVRTPAGASIRTRMEVVDASTLKQAEGDNQNRDRSRDTTTMQVQDIISKFDPELLGEDPSSDRGAPIVGDDNSVDSGNGRMLALNTIYENHPELAAKYRAMIEGKGFSTEGIDRPVLVQRRLTEFTPEQRRQFVIDSNKDTKLELSPVERARSDADSITPEMLAGYAGGDLNSTANAGFVQSFNSRLTTGEMGNMVGSDRRLTPAGQQRIENAVVAHAYGEPKLLERMMESSQDEIRSITGSLADVAGPWARLRDTAKSGDIDASYDITKQLTDAAARVADARKRGIKPADLLTQTDAFDPIDPVTAELIRAFHNTAMTRSASRKAVSGLLQDYIDAAQSQDATPGLFGEVEAQSPVSIIKGLLEQRDNPNGEGMFSLEPKENSNAATPAPKRNEGGNARQAEEGPRSRGKGRGEDVAESRDEGGSEGVAEDRGGYTPSHAEASFTNRQSVYDSAIRATGLTNDQFNLLPPARKVKLLTDALKKLTGISASLTEKMPLQHAIDQLLDAHQTLQGMASVLGITPQALSLKGQLKLQLVKSARFLGAFYPGLNLIKLPGRSNSFAHEWAHALDWHLLNMLTPSEAKGLTGEIRNEGTSFQPANVREAFVHLLNTMFFDGAGLAAKIMKLEQQIASTKSDKQRATFQAQIDRIFNGNSQAKEKSRYWKGANANNSAGGDSGYWTRPTEMFARAFEAWIAFKTDAEGMGNEFITKGNERYSTPEADGITDVYPQAAERMAIFDAMQKVMDAVNAEALLGATPRSASDFDATATPAMKAEASKAERKTRGLLNRLIGPDIEAWQIGRENARIDALDSEGRARDPVKLLSKANNVRSLAFSAASDGVKMIATRWNSKAALRIHDHFQHDLGGTRYVGRVWEEAVNIRENKAFNPIFKLLEEHGSKGWVYKKLDPKQRDTLRRLLLGETVEDDMGMTKLASAMRRVFNDEWYANKNAGIDLGYVKDTAYLNRQTDRELVAGRPAQFLEQATMVYELVFDRDVGADADEIAGDEDRLANFIAIAKRHKIAGLKELRAALREAGKETDPDAEPDPEAVIGAIEEMYDEVRSAYAITAASEYRDAILHTETFPDFTATSSLPDSEKRRSLPPEADELLKDFYNPDPISSFMQYVANSVRRTEWATRFGPAGEKGKALDEQMAREGVPEADRRYVWSLVERMSGRYKRTGFLAHPGVAGTLALLRVKGTLAMMGRAVTLSFFEPMSMGIVTGRPWDGLRAVAKTWANVLSKGSREEKMEWARAQGFIKHHMLEQIRGMDRFGTTSDTPSKLDRLPSAMFRNTGLTFLTDASDAAVADVGRRGTLVDMAHRVVNGGKRGKEAANLMRELGIRDPGEFAKQIVEMDGALPSDEWLAGPEGYDYNTALIRLTKMTIQKPGAADLAPLGRNPLASYATYSITAFLQSSYRNLFKRQAKIGTRLAKAADAENLARFLAGTLSSVALLYAFNAMSSVAREMLFNPDRQEEWEQDGDWWSNNLGLAASRTFSFGALDPVVNSYTGLKYNRDLSYLPLGAYAGNDAQNLSKIVRLATNNSRKTNTAEHNALQGIYGFAISPMLAAGASLIPPGPFGMAAGGFATSTGTSPQAAKAFASAIVGEKNTPKVKTPTALDRRLDAAFGPKEKKPTVE